MKTKNSKRPALFGPGTKAMLIGIAGFAIYSFASKPNGMQRQFYEADANGRLHKVDRPSTPLRSTSPLSKPEPAQLIQEAPRLGLSSVQMRRISDVEARWQTVKANLEAAISKTIEAARPSGRASMQSIQSGLSSYSELSRRYDAERQRYWSLAFEVLSKNQQSKVPGILQEVRR